MLWFPESCWQCCTALRNPWQLHCSPTAAAEQQSKVHLAEEVARATRTHTKSVDLQWSWTEFTLTRAKQVLICSLHEKLTWLPGSAGAVCQDMCNRKDRREQRYLHRSGQAGRAAGEESCCLLPRAFSPRPLYSCLGALGDSTVPTQIFVLNSLKQSLFFLLNRNFYFSFFRRSL